MLRWLEPASSGGGSLVSCTARPAGGINTQRHLGFCFWDSKMHKIHIICVCLFASSRLMYRNVIWLFDLVVKIASLVVSIIKPELNKKNVFYLGNILSHLWTSPAFYPPSSLFIPGFRKSLFIYLLTCLLKLYIKWCWYCDRQLLFNSYITSDVYIAVCRLV